MNKFSILTIFPKMFESITKESILKRAIGKNLIDIELVDIRSFSKDKTHRIDRPPVGGGAGLIMQCQPIYDALKSVKKENSHVIILTPRGKTYTQEDARRLKDYEHLILIVGHYEGIDERIYRYADEEISIGDYILTGGEIAAMAIVDSISRLVPGVITSSSLDDESFDDNLLEYPQFAEPYDFLGDKVPSILYSGNHEVIAKYRKKKALDLTKEKRPDLYQKHVLTKEEKKILAAYEKEKVPKFEREALLKGQKFIKDKD